MILSFGNQLAQDLFNDSRTSRTKKFPQELIRVARRKLFYISEASNLNDLKIPPGNRLEALKGDLREFYSIRINDQWRVIFMWKNDSAYEVSVVDYQK